MYRSVKYGIMVQCEAAMYLIESLVRALLDCLMESLKPAMSNTMHLWYTVVPFDTFVNLLMSNLNGISMDRFCWERISDHGVFIEWSAFVMPHSCYWLNNSVMIICHLSFCNKAVSKMTTLNPCCVLWTAEQCSHHNIPWTSDSLIT